MALNTQQAAPIPYTTDVDAAYRMMRQIAARRSLIEYAGYTFPRYKAADHLLKIAWHLEQVMLGHIRRLMIITPPRHGKSLLVSQRFPLWYLGHRPQDEIIHGSYGGLLAQLFGRRLRNQADHLTHRAVFPSCALATDSRAANLWHTKQGGVYSAAGVGGPITGFGAHLGLIDDPVKNRAEAESERMRDLAWDWYTNDFYSRLMNWDGEDHAEPGRVVLIQTRWHEDDLAGRLLAAQEAGTGDDWVVLHYPAISEDFEPLWPEKYDLPTLEKIRSVVGPRAWESLYQGNPTPEAGTYFKKDWINHAPLPPLSEFRLYGASDFAVTDDAGDYTVHLIVGIHSTGQLWALDLWRDQTTALEWRESLFAMMRKHQPTVWLAERDQILRSVGGDIGRGMRDRNILVPFETYSSSGDKPTKARSIQGYMQQYGLWLPLGAPWTGEVESELLKFPQGKNDDIVDCFGLIGRHLELLPAGKQPSLPLETQRQIAKERELTEWQRRVDSAKSRTVLDILRHQETYRNGR